MENKMEYIKVQLTTENIEYVKQIGSFAKVINYLIQEMKDNKQLKNKIQSQINT